jgi:hypothetical protein
MYLDDLKSMDSVSFEKLFFRIIVAYLVAQEFGLVDQLGF